MIDPATLPAPDWVLRAYGDVLVSKGAEAALVGTFQKILAASDIASVWKSLEKRFAFPEAPSWQWEMSALRLVEVCAEGIANFSGQQRFTQGERVAIATEVSDACNVVVDLLEKMDLAETVHYPDELKSIGSVIRNYCSANAFNPGQTEEEKKMYREGFERGAFIALNKLGEILGALSVDAKNWGKMRPLVARPNKSNAARTYFIRHLTSYFIDEFNAPLRQQTLVLTGAFFDVSDLDASLISKLAPTQL